MTEKWLHNDVADNVRRVELAVCEACAKAGRRREEATLVGVTKTVEPARVNAAIAAGITHIGENYVQELLRKRPELQLEGVKLDLIGHLQTNKVKQVVGQVNTIQSVDSLRLATAISKTSAAAGITSHVLVELNIGEEQSKTGLPKEELAELLAQIAELPHICVDGLMCIPPILDTETARRKVFSEMYQMFLDMRAKKLDNINMNILSMGMSADFSEAIMEGSTMVRVGTALFGHRPGKLI